MATMKMIHRPSRPSASRRRTRGLFNAVGLALLGAAVVLTGTAFSLSRSGAALAIDQAATTTGAASRPASITYREPAANGALVSLDAARTSAALFSGQADLVLEGGLERGPFGTGSYAIYYLETTGPGAAGEASFKVDGRTGEVLEMTRFDGLTAPSSAARLSPLDAEARAEQFASDRFLGFNAMTLVDQSVAPGANGNQLYLFKWAIVATESGAELPTSLAVSLSAASGEVVWYLAQRESIAIDVRPGVDRELAISTAAALVDRTDRWDARSPSSVRLQVIHNQDNRQQLVWAVTFPSKPDATAQDRPNLRILIDARSGEPVSSPS